MEEAFFAGNYNSNTKTAHGQLCYKFGENTGIVAPLSGKWCALPKVVFNITQTTLSDNHNHN